MLANIEACMQIECTDFRYAVAIKADRRLTHFSTSIDICGSG